MIMKNANTLAHGGVGTFAKEEKLELKRINSVKKWRQNRSLDVTGRWPQEDQRVRLVSGALGLPLRHDRTLGHFVT